MDDDQKSAFIGRVHDVVNDGVFDANMWTPPDGQQAMLEKAALLEDWQTLVINADQPRVIISGVVRGSTKFADGKRINTSEVVWVDWKWRWVRTQNTFYRLANQADDRKDDGGDTPRA